MTALPPPGPTTNEEETEPVGSSPGVPARGNVIAWSVLALTLVLTIGGTTLILLAREHRLDNKFEYLVSDAQANAEARLQRYDQALSGVVALFDTLERVPERREWASFVTAMDLSHRYPDLASIGFAQVMLPEEVPQMVDRVRGEGFPDFRVTPAGARDRYSTIIYMEPMDWRNRRVFGYDMYSDPLLREAMDRARDSGALAVSGPVKALHATVEESAPGVIAFLPVYRTGDLPASLAERREALLGFVYTPFRASDLFASLLRAPQPALEIRVQDAAMDDGRQVLFTSENWEAAASGARNSRTSVEVAGREWLLDLRSNGNFDELMGTRNPYWVAGGALLFDFILFALVVAITGQRDRALRESAAINLALRRSNDRLSCAQASASIGIIEYYSKTKEIKIDDVARKLLGMSSTGLLTLESTLANVHPEDIQKMMGAHQSDDMIPHESTYTFRVTGSDGVTRMIESSMICERDKHNRPVGYTSILHDISDRARREDQSQVVRTAWENISDALIIMDDKFRIIDVNPVFTAITGYRKEEVMGQSPRILKADGNDNEFYRELLRKLRREGYWQGKVWNKTRDGELFAARERIATIRDAHGKPKCYVAVVTDVTESVEQKHRLEKIACTDHLTGLPNRAQLHKDLHASMGRAQLFGRAMAICYIDVDGFNATNERLGQTMGDELLTLVANKLKSLARPSDYVARIGGDEFAVVLNELLDLNECQAHADRILCGVRGTYTLSDRHKVYLSASMGISLYPRDDGDPDSLLRHANQAMYLAKENGRDRFEMFDIEKRKVEHSRRRQVQRIEYAVQDNEFVLYYQPKVNMRSGEVIGAEALVRWQHPEEGLLAPARFLPLVEGTAQAEAIDRWVIREALQQVAIFQQHGLDIPVSVNIDGGYLQSPNFVSDVQQALAAQPGVAPAMLELEILESTALTDLDTVTRVIKECQELGVAVSLDDFGTGYASLTYLKQLPSNTLKIDRSFIIDMPTDAESRSLVEGVINLAQAFGRKVIAEGVETDDHGLMLLRMGCEYGQGYGIQPPLPAEQFMEWVQHYDWPDAWRREANNVYWLHGAVNRQTGNS
ncbi:bifunctional diguanylate cyclase/phosphodiesterase [Mangrovimicrobium sediminis]|nr:EAL domain-containing protein [Haliea sp. SAOS-164]